MQQKGLDTDAISEEIKSVQAACGLWLPFGSSTICFVSLSEKVVFSDESTANWPNYSQPAAASSADSKSVDASAAPLVRTSSASSTASALPPLPAPLLIPLSDAEQYGEWLRAQWAARQHEPDVAKRCEVRVIKKANLEPLTALKHNLVACVRSALSAEWS